MKLGLNLSHESGVALTTNDGKVLFAIEEERLSRKKGENRFPVRSLIALSETFDLGECNEVIIGNTSEIDIRDIARFASEIEDFAQGINLDNPDYVSKKYSPGFPIPKNIRNSNLNDELLKLIKRALNFNSQIKILNKLNSNMTFVKHHNGHLGSGLPYCNEQPSIILSMDGEGDWESGAIAFTKGRAISNRTMISTHLDSLGHLYRTVTGYYGLTKSRHEGKITGLAAYGKYSNAIEILNQFVIVKEGRVFFRYSHNPDVAKIVSLLKRCGLPLKQFTGLENVVAAAAGKTEFWPDLAYAVQNILELAVSEVTKYWLAKFQAQRVVLVGGVFANVKLNQKLSEIPGLKEIEVFPNMGDGGLSLGGIWYTLSKRNLINQGSLFDSMYFSDVFYDKSYYSEINQIKDLVLIKEMNYKHKVEKATSEILKGKFVGLHQKGVEFGPRALGNRSILFDPRNLKLGRELNFRLGRTEFMPFAPVILDEYFADWFETANSSLQPFRFMTMTCNVKKERRQNIPGVVHVDGTARPQIVTKKENNLLYDILQRFFVLTGVPLLVNTSFNMHEEPINGSLVDSAKAFNLRCGRFVCL